MASYIELNDLGSFASINALWAAYPEGGQEGDYCTIAGVKYRWDKYDRMWVADPNYGPTPARKVETFYGDVYMQNNLTVAGYIRAKGIKQPCLGLFLTEAALKAKWPEPEVGMWALVGENFPATVYVCETDGEWSETEATGGPDDVDLTSIVDDIATLKRNTNIFILPTNYAFPIDNLYPFKGIEVTGDIDVISSMSIHDTTAYSAASSSTTPVVVFDVGLSNGGSTQVSVVKGDVNSSLGVQRIVKESTRSNIYYVFVIDFDLLEQYHGYARAEVNLSFLKRSYNPFIARRSHLCGGYVTPSVEDTYEKGTKLYVWLENGINTFPHLKTRQNPDNYNAARKELKITSHGHSVVEILKLDSEDWLLVGKVCQIEPGNVVGSSNAVGAVGGMIGSSMLGITSSCTDFSMVFKFRTPETTPSVSTYLFYNRVLTLFFFPSRNSLILYSGETLVESQSLALGTDYEATVRWSNGVATIEIDGVAMSASDKSLTGEEYYPYIGAAMQGGAAVSEFAGIIKGAEIYVSSQKIVELVPQSLTKDAWLDVSGNMVLFSPGSMDASIDIILAEVGSSTGGGEYTDLERVNLFNPEDVMPGHLLDVNSGVIGTWDSDARGEYSAVCITPARLNKYYCIINPYSTGGAIRVGVVSRARRDAGMEVWDYGNPNANNIVLTGGKYTIAKAVCTRTDSTADTINSVIDAISYVVYRVQNTVPYPITTPMIEVYEMNSADEAISYLNSRFGESKELPDDVNIARKLLTSDNVGTLSSMFKNKSMLVLGDSLSANHAWTNYVANQLKWKGINNIAIGGANICGSYNVTSGKQRNLIYQIREAANLLGDVCYAEGELVDGAYTKKMDYVFISMGYNDAHNNWATGSLASVKDVAWGSLAPVNDDAMFSNIAAAVKYCLFLLKTTPIAGSITVDGEVKNVKIDCTHAKIVWQTPIATSNLWYDWTAAEVDAHMIEVENVIAEVCNYYSVPVINGRLLCGITREEENLYEGGKYLSDKTHPNADGYIKLGEMNLKAILGGVGYDSAVNDKQDTLVSGTNIKTVNNQTLLGSGNITIQGGGGGGDQVQADWNQSDSTAVDFIKNKPVLADVATSGSYDDLDDKPTIPAAQIQADWNQANTTAKDFIKNKPTIPAAQVQSNWNESDTSSKAYIQNKPTIPTVPTNVSAFTNDAGYLNNNFCPIIEDTRSSAVAAITGVAPFSTLVDGQRIILHLKYDTKASTTLQLTLSGGTTTSAIPIKHFYNGNFWQVSAGKNYTSNCFLELIYNAEANLWVVMGSDSNATYNASFQEQINAGTSTAANLASPKLIHDNAYIVEKNYSSGSLKANKMYDFGEVTSALTIPSLDATNDLVSNALNFYALRFIAGADNLSITFPTGVIVDDEPTINTGDYVEIMINLYVENNTNHFYASIKVWQVQ